MLTCIHLGFLHHPCKCQHSEKDKQKSWYHYENHFELLDLLKASQRPLEDCRPHFENYWSKETDTCDPSSASWVSELERRTFHQRQCKGKQPKEEQADRNQEAMPFANLALREHTWNQLWIPTKGNSGAQGKWRISFFSPVLEIWSLLSVGGETKGRRKPSLGWNVKTSLEIAPIQFPN